MIEKLCTPSDDDHNEHKKLQLRELAALNGTLKEVTECYLCGMEGHTPEMCPNKVRPGSVYGSAKVAVHTSFSNITRAWVRTVLGGLQGRPHDVRPFVVVILTCP